MGLLHLCQRRRQGAGLAAALSLPLGPPLWPFCKLHGGLLADELAAVDHGLGSAGQLLRVLRRVDGGCGQGEVG